MSCGENTLITPTYRIPLIKKCKVVFDKHGNILKKDVPLVRICVQKLRLSERYYFDNSIPLED